MIFYENCLDALRRMPRFYRVLCLGLPLCWLSACSGIGPREQPVDPALALSTASPVDGSATTWLHRKFPGKKATRYQASWQDGRRVIQSDSNAAASMLLQNLRVEPVQMGTLRFSWKVPELIAAADLTERANDDSPVRVVLAFEGDRSKFSSKNAMLSELSLALTGEALPYATLMYVWGNHRAPGSLIINPRTDRIRALVLESGSHGLGRWLDYERDIAADFEQAFGEAPGALLAVGLMTDTDNTRQQATAWYGPLTLLGRSATDQVAPALAANP